MQLQPVYPVLTERLALRPVLPDDVEAVFKYRSREDVCRYLMFEPQTREQVAARVADAPSSCGTNSSKANGPTNWSMRCSPTSGARRRALAERRAVAS